MRNGSPGNRLSDHQPSPEAQERARAAGLDLEVLRSTDPATYMMICSVHLVYVAALLWDAVQGVLREALPDQELFSVDRGPRILVLAFPGPSAAELEELDNRLAQVAEDLIGGNVYYRIVTDTAGVRRELDLPTDPVEWRGEMTMVGPFANQEQAESWGRKHVDITAGVTFDAVPYAGNWFCDVFVAEA